MIGVANGPLSVSQVRNGDEAVTTVFWVSTSSKPLDDLGDRERRQKRDDAEDGHREAR